MRRLPRRIRRERRTLPDGARGTSDQRVGVLPDLGGDREGSQDVLARNGIGHDVLLRSTALDRKRQKPLPEPMAQPFAAPGSGIASASSRSLFFATFSSGAMSVR